ncbi:hypothetical protein [Staphylococcus durrellii]|uniref:hypothetical protein n=1 Tax=Staphylococcus durrellii TaxID=2781773 RepID=UPI00189D58ED|nr:hypothetical protein [Staphylococcus durrellii]MBF7017991.1 hypothetical protein [Staphylococcus durrellii]
MFKTPITENLSLKILEERDADALFAIVSNNKKHLGKWLPFVNFTQSSTDSKNFIKSALQQFASNDGFPYLL